VLELIEFWGKSVKLLGERLLGLFGLFELLGLLFIAGWPD